MSDVWWRLPGPQSFLDSIMRSLEDGRSVIVRLPEHAPDLIRPLDEHLYDHPYLYRRLILADTLEPRIVGPCNTVLRELNSGGESSQAAPLEALLNTPAAGQHCFVVSGLGPEEYKEWQEFIVAYARAVRGSRLEDRAVFCLFVPAVGDVPEEDVTLAVRQYRGVVTSVDMPLYLAPRIHPRYPPGLERQLYLTLASTLAGFDPLLADELAEHDLDALLNPQDILTKFSARRGWMDCRSRPSWARGNEDAIEGRPCSHAAYCAVNGFQKEIRQLIWEVEVGIVFPFLERLRVALVADLNDDLLLPLDDAGGGKIADPYHLELGHLAHMARTRRVRGATSALRQFLVDLGEARHSLAHLSPVPISVLRRLLGFAAGRSAPLGLANVDALRL